jgi:hypothetical protein
MRSFGLQAKEDYTMNDRVEIILMINRGVKKEIANAPAWIEYESGLLGVNSGIDCLMIGVISDQSQACCDLAGGDNSSIQRGTHSAPCSFNDVIDLFGHDVSKLRLIDASAATFKSRNQFEIPRTGERGFVVQVEVNLPHVGISGLGKFDDDLWRLIAMEAVAGATQLKRTINRVVASA